MPGMVLPRMRLDGFGSTLKDGIYGRGIYLSPLAVVDEDGLRHLVLCRVILGRRSLFILVLDNLVQVLRNIIQGGNKISAPCKSPSSPLIPFQAIISALAEFLPRKTIEVIKKHHIDHSEKKITRQELVRRVRRIAGDELLVEIIKSYRDNPCLLKE
ncbi:hypothetical protein ACH5RR_008869 [Cinchona calisaya]|uniref:RST domain-containing protein n=1 Tax=Cinchona calisaya TaxID=153742 RepID=A0ABD3AGF0_9GENT